MMRYDTAATMGYVLSETAASLDRTSDDTGFQVKQYCHNPKKTMHII